MGKVYAYVKATEGQNYSEMQEQSITEYCAKHDLTIDEWVKDIRPLGSGEDISCLNELVGRLASGDKLVVDEPNRLSRKQKEITACIDKIKGIGAEFIAVDPTALDILY